MVSSHGLAHLIRGGREHRVEGDGAEHREGAENAQREAEIPHAIDDERLHRGRIRRGLVIPEADQQIGGKTHALPAEEELEEIIGRHQHQHGEGEQRQIGEKARLAVVMRHVADGIDVNERGHGVHHHQHHGCQRIDAQRPVRLQVAGRDPGQHLDPHVLAREAHPVQRHPGQRRARQHQRRGQDAGRLVAQKAAEKTGQTCAEQREEDDGRIHAVLSLSSD
jgi:hypothetical protein